MIPLTYIWGGLCAMSIFLLILLAWMWNGFAEITSKDDQTGRDE